MFRFAHPQYLYFLALVPVLLLYFWWSMRRKRRALKEYGDPEVLKQLMPDYSKNRLVVKFSLWLFAFVVLIFMIATPQFGSKLQTMKRKGIEMIIALDVSNSMMAEDISPSRLERAKRVISRMVDKMHNDKIGLVVFAGDAYVQLPITTDYASAKMFLSTITTDIVPVQGTAIGSAINLAMRSFGPESGASRAIVVISDGENHEGNALNAATKAKEKGVVVHTLGMGLPKGAPIPTGKPNTYRKDREGNVVISRLNESMLQEIATAGGGLFVPANNIREGLNLVYKELNKLEKSELETKVYSDYEDQFHYLAWLLLLVLLVDFLILERKNPYLKNIHLFKNR